MAKHKKVYKDGVIPFKNMQEAEQLRKETEERLRQNPMLMNAFICPNNEIFITAIDWGNKYFNIMKYFITVMGFIDIEFHVYIDNDIDNRVLPFIKNKISPLWKVYIHTNMHEGQKDMGVRKELIDEYVEVL